MSDSRVPPHDKLAEMLVLGAMMLSPTAADDVIDIIKAGDFYAPAHSTIYAAIVSQLAVGQPADLVALAHVLASENQLQKIGGVPYLHTLTAEVPTALSATYHAKIVAEKALLRRMIESGSRIIQTAYSASGNGHDIGEIVELVQREIHDATVATENRNPLDAVGDFIGAEIDHLQQVVDGQVPSGLSTGLGSLDEILGGFLPGQLIIPAGRPGMGKSIAALGFAKAVARRDRHALVFSVEMSRRELIWRLLSDVAGIDLTKFTSGRLTPDDMEKARKASKIVGSWPLHIYDTYRTVPAIRTASRRFTQKHGVPGVIIVDYLQRLSPTGKSDRRDLEVGEFARNLKTMAQELGTTVIAPSQLNRGSESRTDKRPQLSDLRESGELEQEADVVILLHRDDYYDKECERAGEADFIIAKHRNGPTETVAVAAQLHLSRFLDMGI